MESVAIHVPPAAAVLLVLVTGFLRPVPVCGRGNGTRPAVPAVLIFGDSIVDTGNNNAILTLTKCNFPPYGKDFPGQQPTGRFCNGRIPSDFVATASGVKDLVPAYLGTELTPQDLLTGVSFASGGSGYDPLTPVLVSVLSMADQLGLFTEYKEKLRVLAGEEKAAGIVSESLFLVCAGTDDIANNYYLAPVRRLQYDISSYVDFLIHQASDFIKKLYHQEARKIAVLGLPPIGCLPSQRTVAGGLERDCDPSRNQAASLFNSRLKKEVAKLQTELKCTKIGYVDIYDILLDIIHQPCKYGFEEASRGCCGTGNFEVSVLCNSLTTSTCANDAKYVFWDSYHPTERAYKITVDYLFPRYVARLL